MSCTLTALINREKLIYQNYRHSLKQRITIKHFNPKINILQINGKYKYYIKIDRRGSENYYRKNIIKEDGVSEKFYKNNLSSINVIKKFKPSPANSSIALLFSSLKSSKLDGTLNIRSLLDPEKTNILRDVFNFVFVDEFKVAYSQLNGQLRAYKIVLYDLKEKTSNTIYEESRSDFFVDLALSSSKRFLIITSNNSSSSEISIMELSTGKLYLLCANLPNMEYYFDHHQNESFILTNITSLDQRELQLHSFENLDYREALQISNFSATSTLHRSQKHHSQIIKQVHFVDNAVAYILRSSSNGVQGLYVWRGKRGGLKQINLPTAVCSLSFKTQWKSISKFYFETSSPLIPRSIFEYDIYTEKLVELTSAQKIVTKRDCIVETISVGDHSIPVTIIRPRQMKMNGTNPLLLQVYGSYGTSFEPTFKEEHVPLFGRGWVVAIAHVRGGGEKGKIWHSRNLMKKHTFEDLENVADYLIAKGYTSSKKLCGVGVSAGGLAFAAVLNSRRDLFRCVILRNPFLDPLSAMMDPTAPLQSTELQEFGDPRNIPDEYEYIKGYSPLHNLDVEKDWNTSLLITGSKNDMITPFLTQQLAYVEKWRSMKRTNGAEMIFKLTDTGGHFDIGSDDLAFEIEFLLDQVNKER